MTSEMAEDGFELPPEEGGLGREARPTVPETKPVHVQKEAHHVALEKNPLSDPDFMLDLDKYWTAEQAQRAVEKMLPAAKYSAEMRTAFGQAFESLNEHETPSRELVTALADQIVKNRAGVPPEALELRSLMRDMAEVQSALDNPAFEKITAANFREFSQYLRMAQPFPSEAQSEAIHRLESELADKLEGTVDQFIPRRAVETQRWRHYTAALDKSAPVPEGLLADALPGKDRDPSMFGSEAEAYKFTETQQRMAMQPGLSPLADEAPQLESVVRLEDALKYQPYITPEVRERLALALDKTAQPIGHDTLVSMAWMLNDSRVADRLTNEQLARHLEQIDTARAGIRNLGEMIHGENFLEYAKMVRTAYPFGFEKKTADEVLGQLGDFLKANPDKGIDVRALEEATAGRISAMVEGRAVQPFVLPAAKAFGNHAVAAATATASHAAPAASTGSWFESVASWFGSGRSASVPTDEQLARSEEMLKAAQKELQAASRSGGIVSALKHVRAPAAVAAGAGLGLWAMTSSQETGAARPQGVPFDGVANTQLGTVAKMRDLNISPLSFQEDKPLYVPPGR